MKTTSTSDSGNSVLSASGAAAAVNSSTTFVHELPQDGGSPHGQARVNIGGTFTGATTKMDGLSPSGTLWIPLLMVSNAGARSVGSSGPTDSTNTSWVVDCRGFAKLRVYNSAGTITSMKVEVTSGTTEDFGGPLANLQTQTDATYAAGVTFSGGTGVNVVSIPDNLADALSFSESSNAYLTFVSTNGSELVSVKKDLHLATGQDVVFTGTTGQSKILFTDNLADALTIGEGANAYITFVSTNSGEKVSVVKALVGTLGITSISPTAGVGYATGAGGTVTQGSSRTTGVTLNTVSGNIVLVSAAGSATPFSFTLTNSAIAAGDTVILSQKSGTDKYTTQVVTAVAAGSCQITLANASGTTTEQPVFNFNVIKGVAA